MLFFPLYFLSRVGSRRCESPFEVLSESIRDFRDKGFTAGIRVHLHISHCSFVSFLLICLLQALKYVMKISGRFLTRCSLFCLLWVGTNYMYIRSLRILLATDVMALFATNVSCVYLLSWVILHEQFVGIRVSNNIRMVLKF